MLLNKKSRVNHPAFFIYYLHSLIAILRRITRTTLEEIIIGFDIRSEINCFTCSELPGSIQHDWLSMMIGSLRSDLLNRPC